MTWASWSLDPVDQIAQWLERVHGKHEVVGSHPTRANFLYGIETLAQNEYHIYIYIYILN